MNALLVSTFMAYAGFAALCLAVRRHHIQVLGRPPPNTRKWQFRYAGWLLIALSVAPCILQWGIPMGITIWLGALSAAALVLIFLLPFLPKTAAVGLPLLLMAGGVPLFFS